MDYTRRRFAIGRNATCTPPAHLRHASDTPPARTLPSCRSGMQRERGWPSRAFLRTLRGMLRIHNLGKRYGDHIVFQGLTHAFGPGCVALCDEDNTGKSTLLAILAGVIAPDEGEVWINGKSLRETPKQATECVAHVPENCVAQPSQTGRSLLEQLAAEKQVVIDDEVLDLAWRLGLEPHLDKPFEQMSTGTRRKVFLVAAALGKPAVVAADGPSDGLDARARAVLAEQFSIWGRDRLVLFASHDAELVQACGARPFSLEGLR